jgi:hypothetical protein
MSARVRQVALGFLISGPQPFSRVVKADFAIYIVATRLLAIF